MGMYVSINIKSKARIGVQQKAKNKKQDKIIQNYIIYKRGVENNYYPSKKVQKYNQMMC
jgi:hypothetical protein